MTILPNSLGLASLSYIVVIVTLHALKTSLLRGGRLRVPKHAHHVAGASALVFKILAARLPRRQQKHHTVAQKAEARALLLPEVVDVLLELRFLRAVLWHKSNHPSYRVLLNVFEVGPVAHIEVVIFVRNVAHDPVGIQIADHVRLHEHAVRLVPRHEPAPYVALVLLEDVALCFFYLLRPHEAAFLDSLTLLALL
jgi:hypothetical protein